MVAIAAGVLSAVPMAHPQHTCCVCRICVLCKHHILRPESTILPTSPFVSLDIFIFFDHHPYSKEPDLKVVKPVSPVYCSHVERPSTAARGGV